MSLGKRLMILLPGAIFGAAAVLARKPKSRMGWLALGAGITSIALAITFVGGGVDDPNGAFQLDGNAVTSSPICFPSLASPTASGTCPAGDTLISFSASSHDWAQQPGGNGTGGLGTSVATGLVSDIYGKGGGDDIFSTNTKDIQDISSWDFKRTNTTAPQDKDDIAHAYAAGYTANGKTVIYFGMDRYDNSGAATAGFWFLQNATEICPPTGNTTKGIFVMKGTCSTTKTPAPHVDGDLLIVSDFSTGGATSEIKVYKWQGNGASGSLVGPVLDLTSTATCDPRTGNSSLCAVVNPLTPPGASTSAEVGTPAPWSFTNKSGQNFFAHGEFLEGAIDLNAIFPNGSPCFSTFMAETRSSNSTSSTLSDFTPPTDFPLCSISLAKKCAPVNGVITGGNTVKYGWTGTVANTGSGKLYDVTITDTLPDGTTRPIVVTGAGATPGACGAAACPAYLDSSNSPLTFTIADISANTGPLAAFVATNNPTNVVNGTGPLDVINTAKVKAASSSGGAQTIEFPKRGSTDIVSAECTAQVNSDISVTKLCDIAKGGATLVSDGTSVKVKVFFTGTVTNKGNTALSGITLADKNSGSIAEITLESSSLAPGASTTYSGSYYPSLIDSSGPGRFLFSDTIRVTGATSALGTIQPAPATANCPSATDLACTPVTGGVGAGTGACPICPYNACIQ